MKRTLVLFAFIFLAFEVYSQIPQKYVDRFPDADFYSVKVNEYGNEIVEWSKKELGYRVYILEDRIPSEANIAVVQIEEIPSGFSLLKEWDYRIKTWCTLKIEKGYTGKIFVILQDGNETEFLIFDYDNETTVSYREN